MKMTYDAYDAELERLGKLPDMELAPDYGVTERDLERVGKDPEKYAPFLMYLSTRPWYCGKEEKAFVNPDALSCREASERIEGILYDAVELYDGDEN